MLSCMDLSPIRAPPAVLLMRLYREMTLMSSHFLAYMARMKLIRRWSLMRNTQDENDLEHSAMVSFVAHMLAVLRQERYHEAVDIRLVLEYALYHEAAEVITGDLASPIKYFNPDISDAFKYIERLASQKMLAYLPEDLMHHYEKMLFPQEASVEWRLVKAADKITAYLKCVEETRQGNCEFAQAESSILGQIESIDLPEVRDFMREFAPSFGLPLDGLN